MTQCGKRLVVILVMMAGLVLPRPAPTSGAEKGDFELLVEERKASRRAYKEKKYQEKWARVRAGAQSHFTLVHYDQFVVQALAMQENYYIPDTLLALSPASVGRWHKKLTHHFRFTDGDGVLLHFEVLYHDEREGVVYPNYALQLNLDIPKHLFKNRRTIPVGQFKGYLAWVHPDFPQGDLFLAPTSGHVFIWRVKEGHLMGRVNLKFDHEKLQAPMHLYGTLRASRLTKGEYAVRQAGVRKEMLADINKIDSIPVHKDRLRPRYEYKLRDKKDPWVEGRSSDLWEAQ